MDVESRAERINATYSDTRYRHSDFSDKQRAGKEHKTQGSNLLAEKTEAITHEELLSAEIHPREILPYTLFADVRMRIAAGGTGKTTLAIYEAMQLALGRELWGQKPPKPCRTVIVSREDSRQTLVARLREMTKAYKLTEEELTKVLQNVRIIDLTGESYRLSCVSGDIVEPNTLAINELINALKELEPDWIIFDPLVSFGVGESRVNDAEQGLIEAFRIIRNRLNCCVEGIHHTGKQNARNKTDDQYSGRGGSALADGARMVAVLNPLDAKEWAQVTGQALERGSTGLVMALPKLSYCKPQESIYIKRTGYFFEMVRVVNRTPEQASAAIAEQVFRFICDQYQQGRKYNKADLDAQTKTLSLSRIEIRSATTELIVSGRVLYHELRGKSGSHYLPTEMAPLGDTPNSGGNK